MIPLLPRSNNSHRNRARSASPVHVFTLTTGEEVLFRCSTVDCPNNPLAEVVTHVVLGSDFAAIWCWAHLPNLQALDRNPIVESVELVSTVSLPSRIRSIR